MPQHRSPKKHMRADAKKRLRNRMVKSKVKTSLRRLAEAPDAQSAREALPEAYRALDRAAKSGVIKSRNAARRKSRLTKAISRKA